MLVYVTVFSLSVAISGIAGSAWSRGRHLHIRQSDKLAALLVGVLLASVSALRWRVGTDYWTYEALFPRYASEVKQSLTLFGEPGIRVIAWIAMRVNGDSATMFAIAAIITVSLFIRTLWRWSPAFSFSIAVYILSGAWHGSFNVVRQYIACAVLFAGHRYIIDRKMLKWIAIVFVASLFHSSALAGLLLYLLPTRRTSFLIQAILVGLGILGMISLGSAIDFLEGHDGDRWGSEYAERPISWIRVLFAFFPAALYWILNVRKTVDDMKGWFYVNMLFVYGATYLAAFSSTLAARFALYPLPFVALGLVYVTALKDARERNLVRVLVLVLYALFMYVEISETGNLRNFQWIFERQ